MGPLLLPRRPQGLIDLAFYRDLKERFHAPGEFAEAYVIATRSATTCRTSLGISERSSTPGNGPAKPKATPCRYASNCRPTASPASGASGPTP